MYKSCLIIATLILTLTTYGQNSDTSAKVKNPLTTYQRDSLILSIQYGTSKIVEKVTGPESAIGRYKVYRTTNIYNSLKLDTATGKVTALQIGINDDKSRFEYLVCDKVEIYSDLQIIGRYELYVIVKTCSDIFYTIGQKKCPMPSAKIRNYSHSHNLVSQ